MHITKKVDGSEANLLQKYRPGVNVLGDLVPDPRLKDAATVRDNRARAAEFGKPVIIEQTGDLACIGHGGGGNEDHIASEAVGDDDELVKAM
ncbi:hypothetical protein AYX13_07019 [Cryptococcus neoformans]|nr:hypothetical protein AYX13_07019 [Cryptococcus neoformans var. grubii]